MDDAKSVSIMGDSEILNLLRVLSPESVSITLEEKLEDIADGEGKIGHYSLKYDISGLSEPKTMYLHMIMPENMVGGTPVHEFYNLKRLSKTGINATIPASQQLELAKKALDAIAEIDPRIKGEDAQPVAKIDSIGTEKYDMFFMRAFYNFVNSKE